MIYDPAVNSLFPKVVTTSSTLEVEVGVSGNCSKPICKRAFGIRIAADKKKKKERKPWIPVTFIVDQHIPLNTYTRADILHGRNLRYHRHHHRFLTSVIYTLL